MKNTSSPTCKLTGNQRRYFANPGGDFGLRNGSFIRESRHGFAQYMNGDYMGHVDRVPDNFTPVETEHAERLIPKCCRWVSR
jgi:hypothetical protein